MAARRPGGSRGWCPLRPGKGAHDAAEARTLPCPTLGGARLPTPAALPLRLRLPAQPWKRNLAEERRPRRRPALPGALTARAAPPPAPPPLPPSSSPLSCQARQRRLHSRRSRELPTARPAAAAATEHAQRLPDGIPCSGAGAWRSQREQKATGWGKGRRGLSHPPPLSWLYSASRAVVASFIQWAFQRFL